VSFEEDHRSMIKEWDNSKEMKVPQILGLDSTDFVQYIAKLNGFERRHVQGYWIDN